jgi:hypothetical protein
MLSLGMLRNDYPWLRLKWQPLTPEDSNEVSGKRVEVDLSGNYRRYYYFSALKMDPYGVSHYINKV